MADTIPAIIVVEDGPDILIVLQRILRDLQLEHDIIGVGHASGALALAVHHRCRLLITDYMLGSMNGLELAREFKARYSCPVILITGYPSSDLRAAAETAGVDEFIAKPFAVDVLETAVRRLLTLPMPG